MSYRKTYWVKDDGRIEETDFGTTRRWVSDHPGKDIKLVEVMPKRVLIYSLSHNGNVFDFDGAFLSKDVLAKILKGTV